MKYELAIVWFIAILWALFTHSKLSYEFLAFLFGYAIFWAIWDSLKKKK